MRMIEIAFGFVMCSSILAQQSASFRLSDQVINLGGNPHEGAVLASANYRITLDALGDAVGAAPLSSTSFRVQAGFVGPYRPPEEVRGLRFTSTQDLFWSPEPAVGTYNLYHWSSAVGSPGSCLQEGIATTSTTIAHSPDPGEAYHYIVTAVNLLAEEGPWGNSRDSNVTCP